MQPHGWKALSAVLVIVTYRTSSVHFIGIRSLQRVLPNPYPFPSLHDRRCRVELPCSMGFLASPACSRHGNLQFPFLLGEPAFEPAQTVVVVRAIFHSSGTCRTCGEICTVVLDCAFPCCHRRWTGSLYIPYADNDSASRSCRSLRMEHRVVRECARSLLRALR